MNVQFVAVLSIYGTGMRLMECIRLRVKDVEFERHELTMRDGKGFKDRMTMIYTHVLNRGGKGVASPLDRL